MRFKTFMMLLLLIFLGDFVDSTSGIYDTAGNRKSLSNVSTRHYRIYPMYREYFNGGISHVYCSEHPGPALIQGQWNIVKLGNVAHEGKCKRQRFKNIRIEAIDSTSPSTIPIMTDGTINVSSFLITQQSLWYRQ